MAKVQITDGGSTEPAARTDDRGGTKRPGLVVATRELLGRENATGFFLNSDFGPNMNVDASASGTPQGVYDGGDTTLWTASSIVGSDWFFTSTVRPRTGSASIYADGPNVNDVMQLAKGSSFDPSAYASLTIWINVDRRWGAGDSVSIYGYDTSGAVQVGNAVFLEDYFTFNNFDVWQKITIPLADFNFTGSFDALRIEMAANAGTTPEWFMDDIQFEEAGAVQFLVEPEPEIIQYVTGFRVSMARAYAGTVSNGTMPGIPYDSHLGLSAQAGLSYSRESDFGTDFSVTINNSLDLLQFGATLQSGSDGTNTWMTISSQSAAPLELDGSIGDRLIYTVSADFSSMLQFRIGYVGYTTEKQ